MLDNLFFFHLSTSKHDDKEIMTKQFQRFEAIENGTNKLELFNIDGTITTM